MFYCTHCGQEFLPQRSTAKYCQDKCRVLAHQKRQREAAKVDRQREAKNEKRRILARLRREWQNTVNTDRLYTDKLIHARMDIEEGCGSQTKIDSLKVHLERTKRRSHVIRKNIEREAEARQIDMNAVLAQVKR